MKRVPRFLVPLLLGSAFLGIVVFVSIKYVAQARRYDDQLMTENIEKLADIFKRIHQCCKIIGFEHKRNYVDFLTVAKFEGNRVGSMNLEYPEKWQGPYLYQPMLSDGKEYEIVQTKSGYYIVPGTGVRLSNEKTVGKDIIVNPDTDIEALIKDPQGLVSHNKPLAARIEVSPGYQDIVFEKDTLDETIETDH